MASMMTSMVNLILLRWRLLKLLLWRRLLPVLLLGRDHLVRVLILHTRCRLLVDFLIRIEIVTLSHRLLCILLRVWLHHRWLLDKHLIVFISMFVFHFILIICNKPLSIDDIFELVVPWWQLLDEEEGPVLSLLHRYAGCPLVPRADYAHVISSMPPFKHLLG